jgi:hypothetical protein
MTQTITTGSPTLDNTIAVAGALSILCSALSHFIPPTTVVGKVISWVALNFGKLLVKP